MASLPKHRQKDIDLRFWSKVLFDDGCWLWCATKNTGYGQFNIKTSSGAWIPQKATHVALRLVGVAVAKGEVVLHKCDNPPCVRPDHLEVGTHASNHADMLRKGRNKKGEEVGLLTEEQVRAMRIDYCSPGKKFTLKQSGVSIRQLAEKYGITHQHVSKIISGKRWGHI